MEGELDIGKVVKLDEVVEVREGVEVGQGLEEKVTFFLAKAECFDKLKRKLCRKKKIYSNSN